MSKTKFILKEDEENKEVEEFTEDTPVEEIPEEGILSLFSINDIIINLQPIA